MGIFDLMQNLFGGVVGDALGGIDIPAVQDLQDQATAATDGLSETANSATEQGQTAVDDITQNLGL